MVKTYSILFFVMMTWGFNVIAIKFLVSQVSPILITSIRLFIASLVILLILTLMKRKKINQKIPWKSVSIACFFAVVLHHLSLSIGLHQTTAVKAGIILGLGPLIAALLSILLQISPITPLKLCGFILGTIGVVMAVLNNGGSFTAFQVGDLWIFVAILAQIIGIFIINKVSALIDPLRLTGIIMFFGSIALFGISLIVEKGSIVQLYDINLHYIWIFIYSCIIPTAIGQSIYNIAINKVGPAETAIFINVNTIFALIGAAIFMKETIMPIQIFGCILIILGVIIGTSGLDIGKLKKWLLDRKINKKVELDRLTDISEEEITEKKHNINNSK